jgi:hypothetical protein
MSTDIQSLRARLEGLDYGNGLSRDELRERLPEMPDEVYIYLPAAKKYYSAEEVLRNTGSNALVRAEGEFVDPDGNVSSEGATELGGPPAYGSSLSPADSLVAGEDDLPGPSNDLAGSSLETRTGRGVPDEYDGDPQSHV